MGGEGCGEKLGDCADSDQRSAAKEQGDRGYGTHSSSGIEISLVLGDVMLHVGGNGVDSADNFDAALLLIIGFVRRHGEMRREASTLKEGWGWGKGKEERRGWWIGREEAWNE